MSELESTPDLQQSSGPVGELFQELPNLAARGLIYLIVTVLLAGALYCTIGEVREVVSARGSLIPAGSVRQLQAASAGRVTRVAVREGDLVQAGQALVYLEAEAARAQADRAQEERSARERQLQDLLSGPGDAQQVAEARARVAQAQAQEATAQRALEASIITAPTAGQVTRVAVHGAGEAVQAGQTVAELAPAGAAPMFEAHLANGDVGRVKVGQTVKIKLDAYPHQEYGALEGVVSAISPDAVLEPNAPPVYRVTITPDLPRAKHGKKIEMRLGLAGTAEIVAHRRKIIELLFKSMRGEG